MAKCLNCGQSGLFLKLNDKGFCVSCLTNDLAHLESEYALLRKQITPEMKNIQVAQKRLDDLNSRIASASGEIKNLNNQASLLRGQLVQYEEAMELESFALYTPRYNFVRAEEFKTALDAVRETQKRMIKEKVAATGNTNWHVNNSKAEGRKMVNDNIKLLLRAFNNECEVAIDKVKFNTFDRALLRIRKSYDTINTLGRVMSITISSKYLDSKIEELHLAYEYEQKKEEEKQALRELREQQREEARAARELEEARKETVKEKTHYELAIAKAQAQLETAENEEMKDALREKLDTLSTSLSEVQARLADIDYRQENQKAGYVYIISNIGAFGADVYKIGMTRRLEPYDRVSELGDASVPFYFDTHAMIFSDNAPKLEAALHQAFADRRINKVNYRKEYFRVTLEEIKEVIRQNHDKTVDYFDSPDAKEYRESLLKTSITAPVFQVAQGEEDEEETFRPE